MKIIIEGTETEIKNMVVKLFENGEIDPYQEIPVIGAEITERKHPPKNFWYDKNGSKVLPSALAEIGCKANTAWPIAKIIRKLAVPSGNYAVAEEVMGKLLQNGTLIMVSADRARAPYGVTRTR